LVNNRPKDGGTRVGLEEKPFTQTHVYTKRGSEGAFRQSVLVGDPNDLDRHISVGLDNALVARDDTTRDVLHSILEELRLMNVILKGMAE
jgi:hypothetical protein